MVLTNRGGAYAGKGGSTTIDEFEVESSRNRHLGSPTVDAVIKLEVGQISNILSRDNLRSDKAWANKINQALTKGIRQASTKPLVVDNIKHDLYLMLTHALAISINGVDNGGFTDDELVTAISVPLVVNLILIGVSNISDIERRLSMFYGPQLDRAALLQVRTRLQKVVKSAEELK